MSFSSGLSGQQDNQEFMEALDKVYNAPNFNRKAFLKVCLNTAKTSKIGGNDYNCTANLEKLFLECERLSDIAQQKTKLLNEQKKQLEAFESEKTLLDDAKAAQANFLQAQKDLKAKDAEIEYLKTQLKKKDQESKGNKQEKERMQKEHKVVVEKMQKKIRGGDVGDEDKFRLEDLDRVIFDTFNKDLKKRLDFIRRILDWQRFGDIAQGIQQEEQIRSDVQDGELAFEHFTISKSTMHHLMDKVYFPVIDAQVHLEMYTTSDFAIKLEHEKYQDMILVELITLQQVLKQLGYDASILTPGSGDKHNPCQVSEHDRMIIGGLMKRLLNQIPVRVKGERYTVNDFHNKMSNLYLLLRQRTSIKNAFELSLDIQTQKAQDDIDQICERILSCIMDYDDYCKAKEEEARHKNEMPQRILNLFQRKIAQKMISLKKVQENQGSNKKKKEKYQSSMINQ